MRTTSYSDLRKNLATVLDSVTDDRTPILVTRDRGRPAAVLMSLEDFASYAETDYLLSNPANAEHLKRGLKSFEDGREISVGLTDMPDEDNLQS